MEHTGSSFNEPYTGEPETWSISQLEKWLVADESGFTSGQGWRFDSIRPRSSGVSRAELVKRVSTRLDALYASFKPSYHVNLDHGVRAEMLPPWSRVVPVNDSPWMTPNVPAGSLERCFNNSYGRHERIMAGLTAQAIPIGLHPLDDYRQNVLFIAKGFDDESGKSRCIIMQDVEQTEGRLLSVRDVRLLPPGGRLKPGSRVILLKKYGGISAVLADDPELEPLFGHPGVVQDVPSAHHANVRFPSSSMGKSVFRLETIRLALACDKSAYDKEWNNTSSWVVFKDLKSRPELNGRLGRTALGAITSQQADSERVPVHVLDWERPLGGSLEEPWVTQLTVNSQLKNLECVADIHPAIIVAFSSNKAADIQAGGPRYAQKISAEILKASAGTNYTQNIKCSVREIRMFKAALNGAKLDFTASEGTAGSDLDEHLGPRAILLGNLSPKMWELSILTPTEHPLNPEEVAKKRLRSEGGSCRRCSASEVTLSRCQKCLAVQYCSKACQLVDWKVRHKLECKGMTSATPSGAETPQADAESTPPVNASDGVDKDGEIIVVDMVGDADGLGPYAFSMSTFQAINVSEMPKNLHGDREFIVKVQNGFDPSWSPSAMAGSRNSNMDKYMFARPFAIYDQARSFWVSVGKSKSPDQFVSLSRVIKDIGHGQHPLGKRAFLFAKRVGGTLHLTISKKLPSQQQSW